MVLSNLYCAELQKVSGDVEKKICEVGLTKILTESPALLENENNVKVWTNLLDCLVELFELPQDTSTPDDDHFIDIEDTPGYQPSFNQLYSTGKKEIDPFKGQIPDAKIFLAQSLRTLSSQRPNTVN